jgi:nickel/cobalt exporter
MMNIFSISRPLLAGVLHSFEPDHVTAVSVLAADNAIKKRKASFSAIFRASQWAMGHSVTLLLFGMIALLFKSSAQTVVEDISYWAEVAVGPIMILLGTQAVKRNHKINNMMRDHKKIEDHDHLNSNPIHLHGKNGEEIAMNPLNRSFWVGMLHGLAGTGGMLTSALVISASTIGESIMILLIESVGIILAMGAYSYVLISTMSRFIERNMAIFKWMNGLAGLASIFVGLVWIYNAF